MVRNAMEAALPGEAVTMGFRGEEGGVAFWVHNSAVMPENVRLRVFNRFFSTKGRGRGLGAYAMKYLTEKYLLGKVDFTSTDDGGTTFVARFPGEFPKKMDL
jgi:sensor histidine kinase regulating citrate/malate metabolism